MFNFKINIADVIVEFESKDSGIKYVASDMDEGNGIKGFLYRGKKKADIHLRINGVQPLKFSRKRIIFDVKDNWRLSRWSSKFLYEYPIIKQSIIFDSDMRKATIYKGRFFKKRHNTYSINIKNIIDEIRGNFLQALFTEYLPRKKKGILIHSACVRDYNKTYLFVGPAGSGKSTMARLWSGEKGSRIFNDDRVILLFKKRGAYFYNTPWRGNFYKGYKPPESKDRVRIDKIFFIYHERENIVKRLSKEDAAYRLFRNTFLPFWNTEVIADVWKSCLGVANLVPCYNLGFVKVKGVVDFVRNLNDKTF